MFNAKNKNDMQPEKTSGNGTTLIGAGTSVKGDITSNSDLRIDGTITGNVHCAAKIVVGANGTVEGDITGNQADIVGKVSGNIRAKDLLQLRGDSMVTGNIYAGRLQIEPSATFNGQCFMGANVVEMNNNEQQAAVK
ncbi:MAG: polymer-forming cytoskeletal protein [Chitinophagaceae bacterium]|nr:polymer-forming cytoskeletal protein [Chitinophagaceae bacterium]MBL0334038.1 polymer-forming cytoskeletal protein [Chitinophagaceae bacterium]